jgi:branched-chain amino acid transport system substrate-binding protein
MRQHAPRRNLEGDRLRTSDQGPHRAGGISGAGSRRIPPPPLSRRSVLRAAGAGAAVLGGGGLLQACSSGSSPSVVLSGRDIVIAFIHPLTGALAGFGAADAWIVDTIMATPQFQGGFTVGGKNYPVTIKSYDTRSDPVRASQLARQAILADKVDLIVTSATAQTVNPVAAVAEKLGTTAICGGVPWPSWYASLGGNPTAGKSTFKPAWATLFFLGASDLCQTFIPMWNKVHGQVASDMTAACLFPGGPDGDALRAAWPAYAGPARYTLVDPPAAQVTPARYSSAIGTFKTRNCDLFTNAQPPADFAAFWRQAATQGYKPKLVTVTGSLQFPSEVTALGPLARNVATAAWWTPNMPWTSSLTGQSCTQLATAFTAATGLAWVQSLSDYSLFEVAHAALTSVNNPHDKTEVAQALFRVNIRGVAGTLDWTSGSNPAPGVVDTGCVGAQWRLSSKNHWSLLVVDNTMMPQVPVTGTLDPTSK